MLQVRFRNLSLKSTGGSRIRCAPPICDECELPMEEVTHGYVYEWACVRTGPADVHYGLAAGKALERSANLAAARAQHPERFSTARDPKILTLHETVWINKPAEDNDAKPETKLAA